MGTEVGLSREGSRSSVGREEEKLVGRKRTSVREE